MERPALGPALRRTLLLTLPVTMMVCLPAPSVRARSPFSVPLSEDQRIIHALTRLTFGPRPGEVARVRALGLHRWITLQLHPEQLPENPILEAKVQALASLALEARQLVLHFPSLTLMTELAKAQEAGHPYT